MTDFESFCKSTGIDPKGKQVLDSGGAKIVTLKQYRAVRDFLPPIGSTQKYRQCRVGFISYWFYPDGSFEAWNFPGTLQLTSVQEFNALHALEESCRENWENCPQTIRDKLHDLVALRKRIIEHPETE